MRRFAITAVLVIALSSCATPSTLVYSSGFSFGNYDYVVVSKPDGDHSSTALYGMDVEFANLMSRYDMKVIGDKELATMPPAEQRRALFARMSLSASNKRILLSVSFDDVVTGKTESSITTYTKGNLFDVDARTKAFQNASDLIVEAMQKDRGLQITQQKPPS
jgi:hypothetical protein